MHATLYSIKAGLSAPKAKLRAFFLKEAVPSGVTYSFSFSF
jgi:hypothetical protein